MSSTDLKNVESDSWPADTTTLDLEPARPREEDIFTTDYYEILRIGPQADEETIERIYRTLADRFHPDNPSTGDPETFLRIGEAYHTLSNPARRAKYDVVRQHNKNSARFWLRGREFFDGVRGGQNRRLAVLCLLYRQRISAHESPGLTILDLERLTGCTREEITSALWYLCEKKWGTIGESTAYSITADGFDVVESKLEDRLEFRALATVRYYGLPAELKDPAHVEPRFWKDTLPLYIEPARTIEGDIAIADHYEILGIGPQADEEVIERVYRTLAGRFHPDNPSTGDPNTFRRITEAYDTLSDQARRAQYDALRRHSKHSARFHLRGREFFDGIKGEQLRRLAVLCLLYRQAVSESAGLTVLDLEQLTGCTREELSSALWYLREKKWARSGEYTEYSITAAGFDVVENAAQPAAQSQSSVAVTLESPISNTTALENRNSHWIAQSKRTEIEAGVSSAKVEVAQGPIPNQEALDPAVQVRLNRPIAPENCNPQRTAESEGTNIPYKTFLSRLIPQNRTPPPPPRLMVENVGVAQIPAPIVEVPGLAEPVTRLEVAAAPAAQSQQNSSVTPQAPIRNTPVVSENPDSRRMAESWAWLYPEDTYGSEFLYPGQAGPVPTAAQSQHNVTVALEFPASDIISSYNPHSQGIAENEQPDINDVEPSSEHLTVAQGLALIEEAFGIAEHVAQFSDGAEPEVAQSQQNVPATPAVGDSEQAGIKAEEPSNEKPVAASASAQAALSRPGVQVPPESQGFSMSNAKNSIAEQPGGTFRAEKRVILSMGGKGGVGKTSVMTGLAEWFEENRIPVTMLDLDIENKAIGSLAHFFGGRVPKINIHTPAGLDAFVDNLAEDAPVILADMGAGAGQITHDWFDKMYPDVAEAGVAFTAIGVVTSDPASVESVLNWAAALQDRVAYVIVRNNLTEHTDFSYWEENDQAREFRRRFQPAIIRLDYRLADLENAVRNYGVTLGQVACRTASAPELQKASLVMRAQSYRRRMFAEFDNVRDLLLP